MYNIFYVLVLCCFLPACAGEKISAEMNSSEKVVVFAPCSDEKICVSRKENGSYSIAERNNVKQEGNIYCSGKKTDDVNFPDADVYVTVFLSEERRCETGNINCRYDACSPLGKPVVGN